MKKLMKKLTGSLLVLAMAAALFSGCSDKKETSTADNTKATAAPTAVATEAADAGDAAAVFEDKDPSSYSGTITIWAWDKASEDKVVAEFNKVYPNIKVEVVSVGYSDYINKVQTALAGGGELPDIIKAEYGFRAQMQGLDVFDYLDQAPYTLDTSNIMDYEIPVSSYSGHIVGIENSVNTAGFAYKKDLAEKYLGTSDPAELQAMFTTWDDYINKGKEVYDASSGTVNLIASWGDMSDYLYNWGDNALTENNKATDYLLNTLPDKRYDLLQKMFADNTVDKNIAQIYDASYLKSYSDQNHIFYLCSTWHKTAYIDSNDGENNGNWRIITPPDGPINLGGTNDGIWKDSPNKELAWQYIKWISLSTDGGNACIKARGYYIPYKPFINEHDFSADMDPFFGDQNTAQLFAKDMAADVLVRQPEIYFNQIKTSFETVEIALMQDLSISKEDYKKLLKQEIMNNCPDLEW